MPHNPSATLRATLALTVAALLGMAGCATGPEMTRVPVGYTQTGEASWYGKDFHGRPTASGEPYDMWAHTAAHRTLAFNSRVRVTHLGTGASTVVRINDRGPFVKNRIIDLSLAAARDLGMDRTGTAQVRIQVVGDDGVYLLQLASFKDRANAETLRDRVRGVGYDAQLQQAGNIIRVVIRDLDSAAADRVTADLVRRGFPTPLRRVQTG